MQNVNRDQTSYHSSMRPPSALNGGADIVGDNDAATRAYSPRGNGRSGSPLRMVPAGGDNY